MDPGPGKVDEVDEVDRPEFVVLATSGQTIHCCRATVKRSPR